MAESTFGGPLQGAFPLNPTPPALRPQNPETVTPNLYPFPSYENPLLTQYPAYLRPPLPEPYGARGSYLQQGRHHQFASHSDPRTGFYAAQPGMFHHGPSGNAPLAVAPTHAHGMHMPGGPPDYPEPRNVNNMFPFMDPSVQGGMPSSSPHFPPRWSPPPLHEFHRHAGPHVPIAPHPGPGRYSSDAVRSGGGGGDGSGPTRRAESDNAELPRHIASPHRRTSYERQHHYNAQIAMAANRRAMTTLIGEPARRPDRSVSPRTSSRRSYDRYSTDLSQPGNASEMGDAARSQNPRVRRPRTDTSRLGYRARMFANYDPNVPTQSQMSDLKNKLRHLLPNELPEGTSSACDICQKDYSSKYVEPTEDLEGAIQLPCKHVFGEHCINTWVR